MQAMSRGWRTWRLALAAAAALAPGGSAQAADPQAAARSADHAARGLAVAQAHFPGLASLCDTRMRFVNVNVQRPRMANGERGQRPAGERGQRGDGQRGDGQRGDGQRGGGRPGGPRGEDMEGGEPLEAMRLFDDFYFLGNAGVSAFLAGSEQDGFILIDALTSDTAAEADIIGGMARLGLDPGKIRHFLISHAHGDHYGGHRFLRAKTGLPVMMSAPDWSLAATLGDHPRFGPAPLEGITVNDGQIIQLGKTRIEMVVTSAHTPGTISPIITVHDRGVPHRLVLWGGTGFNFGANEAQFRNYAASAARLRNIGRARSVDIFLSNHSARDGSDQKMRALAIRKPTDPHPFVTGATALKVFDVLEHCALAQAERLAAQPEAEPQ